MSTQMIRSAPWSRHPTTAPSPTIPAPNTTQVDPGSTAALYIAAPSPVESARMGWGLATIAGVAGKGEVLEVVPRFLITGRRIVGASFGGVKGRDQVPELVDRYLAGDIDVDSFISHRISLDDVNKGFDLMHAQDGIRSVIGFQA